MLTLRRQQPPVDVQAIIERAAVPVVERVLFEGMRGTIGDVAGRRTIILNRKHRFHSEQERRWVLAEELGHVLLGHQLLNSEDPGKSVIGLLQPQRLIYEREAKAFAAELLMPFFDIRRRWSSLSLAKPVEGELSMEAKAECLAEEFRVMRMAMRMRLQQMKLIRQ